MQAHVDREVAGVGDEQRLAVGRRLLHDLRGDDAARAGPVVDDHRVAEALRELVGHRARHDVGRAAGAVGNDEAQRFLRERITPEGKAENDDRKQPKHCFLSVELHADVLDVAWYFWRSDATVAAS